MPDDSSLLINVEEMLSFFDEKPDWSVGHSAAVVAMLFEDLAAATFEHCLSKNGATHVLVRSEPVATGRRKGPRLDRWIEADLACGTRAIFQTEIKSLSAQSFGHKTIALDASDTALRQHEQENWNSHWDQERRTLTRSLVAKVLVPMKRPNGTEHRTQLPLLICWNPMKPNNPAERSDLVDGGHLFKVSGVRYDFPFETPPSWWKSEHRFNDLWVFSVSSYLRSLRGALAGPLALPMPNAAKRIRALLRVAQMPTEPA